MPYIDLKQASEATGKSIRTIRRLCNDSKSKDYISYEDGKLVVEVSYLAQHYPMKAPAKSGTPAKSQTSHGIAKDSQNDIAIGTPQIPEGLQLELELLKEKLKHKDEMLQQKDKQLLEKERQVEILERSLLMLGEGLKREPAPEPTPAAGQQPTVQEPPKKKRWWPF